MNDEQLLKIISNGYDLTRDSQGRITALMDRYICADLNEYGHDQAWRYSTRNQALKAYLKWDLKGEPEGWLKHYPSMRRRDDKGTYLLIADVPHLNIEDHYTIRTDITKPGAVYVID